MPAPVKERIEARENGLVRYFTGKPCKNGHVAERFVSDGRCLECNRIKMQKYWANNPNAVEKRNDYLRLRKVRNTDAYAKDLLSKKERWNNDPVYREQMLLHMRKRKAKYRLDPEYVERNRQYGREWPSKNRAAYRAKLARRRARLKQAMPLWADKQAILAMYVSCPDGYHVDHIVPINGKNVCGLHVHWNLQHLPAAENLSKGNRLIIT